MEGSVDPGVLGRDDEGTGDSVRSSRVVVFVVEEASNDGAIRKDVLSSMYRDESIQQVGVSVQRKAAKLSERLLISSS
jgi:hypothetical protein